MKKIGFIAMSGVRAHNEELTKLGLTLPGFVERNKVIASLPSLSLLTLAGLTPKSTENLYNAACGYSLCAGTVAQGKQPEQLPAADRALHEKYAARAVVLLREAVQAGYKNVAHIKRDSDLDPLRQREDFQKLLAELQGSEEPEREKK